MHHIEVLGGLRLEFHPDEVALSPDEATGVGGAKLVEGKRKLGRQNREPIKLNAGASNGEITYEGSEVMWHVIERRTSRHTDRLSIARGAARSARDRTAWR